MIKLLEELSKKYYLQLGDYSFSPILKLTGGISLEYCSMLNAKKCPKEPFVFCFPEKKAAALWTSISILTNYYLEDYINIGDDGIALKAGDKVLIYGCVAQIERIQNGSVSLKFKDQGGLQLNDRLRMQLSLVNPNRVLNLLKKYKTARKEAKKNRNPISKILYPNDEVIINQHNLKSKILLVAGRGQVKKFHDFLETVEIYGEKLQRVFPEGENLIITPDLKRYKIDENRGVEIGEAKFIQLLEKALNKETFEEVKDKINELVDLYKTHDQITQKFDRLFSDFIDDHIEIIPQLKILGDNYPGLIEDLHSDIRAVVINDISQLIEYPKTVKFFLEKDIPVIVFSDRNVIKTQDTVFYKNLFQENDRFFRLNWNKKKLSTLKALDSEMSEDFEYHENKDGAFFYLNPISGNEIPWTEDVFIDQELWNQSMRYESQVINIQSYQGGALDILAPKVLKQIRELEEFEILQKSFYRNLFPALYALKNSQSSSESVKRLIGVFKGDIESVVDHLPKEVADDFHETIAEAETFSENSKNLELEGNIFSIVVPTDLDEAFTIPLDFESPNTPNEKSESIIFTGYPFDEYRSNYLINSVSKFFIPEIELKCWRNEASLTYNYLRRRIEGGYFYDRIPKGIDIDQSLRIESEEDIESEIDRFLLFSNKITDFEQSEEEIAFIYQFQYKGYLSSHDSSTTWKVNCDVLNFENGDFMFLNKRSTILCLSEDDQGKMKVFKKSADQFRTGDVIFKYVKDRAAYREISRRDPVVGESYKELDFWRNVLQELYSENHSDSKQLGAFLRRVKENKNIGGNPVYTNIERWIFDEELISPDKHNLRLILSAAEIPRN